MGLCLDGAGLDVQNRFSDRIALGCSLGGPLPRGTPSLGIISRLATWEHQVPEQFSMHRGTMANLQAYRVGLLHRGSRMQASLQAIVAGGEFEMKR